MNTKLHTLVDGLGNPIRFLLSPGNDHDSIHAAELLERVSVDDSTVLGDRAYGTQKIRGYLSEHGANYVIPPKDNSIDPWLTDWYLYKKCHLVKCFFQKIKWFRRIATRYDRVY